MTSRWLLRDVFLARYPTSMGSQSRRSGGGPTVEFTRLRRKCDLLILAEHLLKFFAADFHCAASRRATICYIGVLAN
jgi:hypothetical protein